MKTKNLLTVVALSVAILAFPAVISAARMIPVADQARDKAGVAVESSPAIEGDWALTPPGLEKIEFIHYKKGFAKPDAPKAPKSPSCYKFLTPGKSPIRWRNLPVNYAINPTNPQGLAETFITGAVSTSAETWDAVTGKELMSDTYAVDSTAVYGIQDYENAITFGDYPTTGVIAVTAVWYNPATKAIVEFDIMFDTDWTWGDATADPVVMDLQNIATHELGHGVGLADVYETACGEVTMYGYSDYGETKKQTLEQPDITGLQELYGGL